MEAAFIVLGIAYLVQSTFWWILYNRNTRDVAELTRVKIANTLAKDMLIEQASIVFYHLSEEVAGHPGWFTCDDDDAERAVALLITFEAIYPHDSEPNLWKPVHPRLRETMGVSNDEEEQEDAIAEGVPA